MKKVFLIILAGISIVFFIYNSKVNEVNIPDDVISQIMIENVEPIFTKKIGHNPIPYSGRGFCDYALIASEEKYGETKVYLNVWYQEFYVEGGTLKEGSGGEFPAVLHLKKQDNKYLFKDIDISTAPESREAVKIFPMRIRKTYDVYKQVQFSDEDLNKRAGEYFTLP